MTQLARAGGYESHAVANLQYGKLEHLLSDALGGFISERENGSPNRTFALGEVTRSAEDSEWVWVMRPEVAQALEQLDWVEDADAPAESPTVQGYTDVANFELGRTYNRRDDIHARFGGQRQGGISTPSGVPYIFLFTGESGEQYGYGWDGPNRASPMK
jgi:hypothetical protein